MDALRSALQPITHNLPGPLRDFGASLIGDKCYKALVLDIDVENTECLKLAVSKGLGVGIVGASAVVKVPQIIKLVRSKSASGVSFLSYVLETSSLLTSLAYNYRNEFPISTYGESALILVQNVVITGLLLRYSGQSGLAAVFVGLLAVAVYSLFDTRVMGMETLTILQGAAGVVGVASKLPQIVTIFREGGTGQLSAFAVLNYLLGSLSRIFTTLQEVDDKLILYGFIAGFSLNLVLALQMAYYWNAPSAKAKGKRKEKLPASTEKGAPSYAAVAASTSGTPSKKGPTTRRRG